MKDILLTAAGDLRVSEYGDIALTDSVRQAVRIRLQWFFDEWRLGPQFGIEYFELFLVKAPNKEQMRQAIRDAVMSVDEVVDAENIDITIDNATRKATITLDIVTDGETFREELLIHA
jgi:hypothetical protein